MLLALKRVAAPALLGVLPVVFVAFWVVKSVHGHNLGIDFRSELYPETRFVLHGRNPFPPPHAYLSGVNRIFYCELLPSESPADCVAFFRRAVSWYAEHGIRVERVLSDNGNGYRSHAWAAACTELGIGRRYTRPRRPQTNGKAEALVKTLLREWAYRFAYPSSSHRARALPGHLRWYNHHRPHSSLSGQPPITRVSQVRGSHS